MKFLKIAGAVVLLAGSLAANAATSSQTLIFESGATNYDSQLNYSLFDNSLGTLNSVTIVYDFGVENGTFSLKNTGLGSGTVSVSGYTLTSNVGLTVYDEKGSFYDVASASGEPTSVANVTLNRNESTPTYTAPGIAISGYHTYTAANLIDLFSNAGGGTGTFEAIASSSGSGGVTTTGSGSLSAIYNAVASGSVTLTYNYTAAPVSSVPEPESYAMMLVGLGALGVVARRRRVAR